jgi:hypothetical protein
MLAEIGHALTNALRRLETGNRKCIMDGHARRENLTRFSLRTP